MEIEPNDKENVDQLKNSLRSRLNQSGVNNLIRHMVRDICASRGDTENIDPEDIVQELYNKGLMKTVLDNVEWTDNMERSLQEKIQFKCDEIVSTPRRDVSSAEGDKANNLTVVNKDLSDSNVIFEDSRCKENNKAKNDVEASSDRGITRSQIKEYYPENTSVVEEIPYVKQTTGRLNGKYFLKIQIVDGRNFLDQLFDADSTCEQKSTFILHVSYKHQRFYAKPTQASCDPKFHETFMIDIGYFENGSVLQLLAKYEPVHIILLQQASTGERKLLSSCLVDWRSQLMSDKSSQKLPITLMGIGPEFQVPVGILNTKIGIAPILEEILSASTYAAQINAERSIQDEKERLFLIYVKQWFREFLEIRSQHVKRNVKIFSYDENTTPRPIQTFVKPIIAGGLLLTPFHAAWFVSLIRLTQRNSGEIYSSTFPSSISASQFSPQVLCNHWQSLISTLTTKCGGVEDHATLLCSLLLGFGLDAYVAIGNLHDGAPWVWVVTLEAENQFVSFWESTTGKIYPHRSFHSAETPAENGLKSSCKLDVHGLKTISCMFNNKLFYANIQHTAILDAVDWNVYNPSKWKKIPESTLKSSTKYIEIAPKLIVTPSINVFLLSSDIEIQMKTIISEYRMKNNLHTTWSTTLANILGQELAKYELEVCTGTSSLPGYFQAAILKNIPDGYEFKGYPWNGNTDNCGQIFKSLKRHPKCQEIMLCRGNDVQFACKVLVFAYPEDVLSVRLMLACKFVRAD